MAMMKLQCLSHTPLMGLHDPSPQTLQAAHQALELLRLGLEEFDPELIILFAPDHFNGFFYDLMPSFCVGVTAESIGDYATARGALQVPAEIAEACAQTILDHDVDCAISYRMKLDHGFAQPLELLTGALARYPVVPIFINSVAVPLPRFQRVRLLGHAVGIFAKTLNRRVLFMASGGLSHNPPVPTLASSTPEVIERLIAGRNPTAQARTERQSKTISAAIEFAAGSSSLTPLNPLWDRKFLATLESGNLQAFDAMSNAEVTEVAGASAHEVKCWVAANAAMAAATGGRYAARADYYEAIPEWIAGFATMQGNELD